MSLKSPDISVVMPCFNAECFVRDSILSVINQTFVNFELIIINDGSTDNTLSIVNSFEDPRIFVFSQINQGLSISLNKAIELSRGKYIARIDADDICFPNRLELQYRFMENHLDIDVLGGAVNFIDDKNIFLGRSFPYTNSKVINYFSNKKGNVLAHPTVMVRKNSFKSYGMYSETLKFYEDYHLWRKFLRQGAKIKNISNVLINYRISENSVVSKYPITNNNKYLFNLIMDQDSPSADLVKEFLWSIKLNKNSYENRIISVVRFDFIIYRFFNKLKIPKSDFLICNIKNFFGLLKIIFNR